MLEHPGPPLNQVARGAVVGLLRASKLRNESVYDKHITKLGGYQHIQPKPHVLVCPYGEITRVLINPGGSLADARVFDILQSGTCGCMLINGE